jgi:DNA mismatch endonuclease (patch repair protein)
MSHIKGSRTRPELELKKTMKIQGFSYQPKGVYGNPDFASKKHKIAVFIDGCFWHGCPRHYKKPKSNHDYWKTKITRNKKRDMNVSKELKSMGWKVIRIWEHVINYSNSG